MTNTTRTVDRALQLIAEVVEHSGGASMSELSRGTELSTSTVSRLLGTLAQHNFVRRQSDGRYQPGDRLLQLGAMALRGDTLYERAGRHILELAEETGETANLGIGIEGDRALYLRQAPSVRVVQGASWIGRTIPVRGTAMGRALRGEVGTEGYAFSRGSVEPDVTAVAAPVRDASDAVVGALSVIAPSYRTDDDAVHEIGRALVAHAGALSVELGAPTLAEVAR